jgi:hypothetical protein
MTGKPCTATGNHARQHREIVRGECENAVYDPQCLAYAGLDILLRRAEGEAWCLAHGAGGFIEGEADDDQPS